MSLLTPRNSLLAFIRKLSDAELLELLPKLSREHLELMHEEFAPEECDCPRVYLPCECGVVITTWIDGQYVPQVCPCCEMEPDWEPCIHAKDYYLSWPVLKRLSEILSADPPAPRSATWALTQDALAVVRAQRHAQKPPVGLWHPDDAIHHDLTSDVLDRIERTAYTLKGWKDAGMPNELAAPPAKNGDMVPGQLRIREAA
jgi:hypothetical protein